MVISHIARTPYYGILPLEINKYVEFSPICCCSHFIYIYDNRLLNKKIRKPHEHALAHKLKDKAEATYQRGDMFVKRQGLMEAWSRYCDTIQPANVNNVIPMWASR